MRFEQNGMPRMSVEMLIGSGHVLEAGAESVKRTSHQC
jgi:hypothetical protein